MPSQKENWVQMRFGFLRSIYHANFSLGQVVMIWENIMELGFLAFAILCRNEIAWPATHPLLLLLVTTKATKLFVT